MMSRGKGKGRAMEEEDVILLGSSSDLEYDSGFHQHQPSKASASVSAAAQHALTSLDYEDALSDKQVQKLNECRAEIASIDKQIKQLQEARKALNKECADIKRLGQSRLTEAVVGGKPLANAVNYLEFKAHSKQLVKVAKEYWRGFSGFRHCQEGVCNAMLDGRHLFVIMATGGGKSLCYQLPALITPGITLVVSPLLSLMTDQVMHLKEVGIPCELLSSATPKAEISAIHKRISNMRADTPENQKIKLLYVTPERIVKAKLLKNVLQTADGNGMLSRIVLDEAHCCSSSGHDFRPDYRSLGELQKFFPTCPIAMLTATASREVVDDVVDTLDLPSITHSTNAMPRKTVLFASPLLRHNLAYRVEFRSSNLQESMEQIVEYIETKHKGESGIVYCLSRKDAEVMAEALGEVSGGSIKTRSYHAGLDDPEKERTHKLWNSGKVQVICATIAFGMGIDKPDVRFVLHSSLPKSIEGLYQESGRAGRDGEPADCVLFYRPQDASRIAGMATSDRFGTEKLRAMLKYCQSMGCRKQIFSVYFEDELSRDMPPCGTCDNCLGDSDLVEQDVTYESWQIIKALTSIKGHRGRVTLANLCDLVRGRAGGRYNVIENGGSGKGKAKVVQKGNSGKGKDSADQPGVLKMDRFGGKVMASSDNTERILIELLIQDYIKEEYSMTPYAVNVYMDIGPKAALLSRLTESEVKSKKDMVVASLIATHEKSKTKKAAPKKQRDSVGDTSSVASSSKRNLEVAPMPAPAPARKKLKLASEIIDIHRAYAAVDHMEDGRGDLEEEEEDDDEPLAAWTRDRRRGAALEVYDDEEDWPESHEIDAVNESSSYDGPLWQSRTY